MLSHIDLHIYYSTIWALAQHHQYSIAEIEAMYPFERDIYVTMLNVYLKEKQKEMEAKNGR